MNLNNLLGNERRHALNHVSQTDSSMKEYIEQVKINQVMNFGDYIESTVKGHHPIIKLNQLFTRHVLLNCKQPDNDLQQVLDEFGFNKYVDVLELTYRAERFYKKQGRTLDQKELVSLIIAFFRSYDEVVDSKEDEFVRFSRNLIEKELLVQP